MMGGHELIKEYEQSLLDYWEDGHGDIRILVAELQGFLDCLLRLSLIKEDIYMYVVECFKIEAKKRREFT